MYKTCARTPARWSEHQAARATACSRLMNSLQSVPEAPGCFLTTDETSQAARTRTRLTSSPRRLVPMMSTLATHQRPLPCFHSPDNNLSVFSGLESLARRTINRGDSQVLGPLEELVFVSYRLANQKHSSSWASGARKKTVIRWEGEKEDGEWVGKLWQTLSVVTAPAFA